MDYEAELDVIMGRGCRGVRSEEAYEYVCGYAALNDISARNLQFKDGQWTTSNPSILSHLQAHG